MTVVPEWYSEPPSLYVQANEKEVLGPKGRRGEFVNSRGLKLATYFFPAKAPAKALILLVHGHGCSLLHEFLHSQEPAKATVYGNSMLETLNEAGISAGGIDLQGCGHSQGLRCYIESYSHYLEDVLDFARSITSSNEEGFARLPAFVLGVSLGGCLAVDACKVTDIFKGAILVAPMLSLERVSKAGLNPYLRPIAGFISWLYPTLPVVKTEASPINPEIQAFFDQDPQTWHGRTRVRNAQEYLVATEAICSDMASVTFPFICFHGDIDTMTDPEGSKKLFEESQSADKSLNIIPGRWHVLLKEPGHEDIVRQMIDWILPRI